MKVAKKINKNEKGITLLVLVVTIIVMLILAAVVVKLALGDGGILGEARQSASEWDKASREEQSELSRLASEMRKARNSTSSSGSGSSGEGTGNETGGGSGTGEGGGNQETEPTHKPSSTTVDSSVNFVTETGKIDVIWLDTNNRIIDKPNSPANHLGGMTPVKWNGTTESTTTSSDTEWYNYTAIEGDGDNTTSHWANAKNFGSYFVWIPRYAYRITYYDPTDTSQATGYYDGCGMWKSTGELKLALEEGIETVVKNGWSYIVHPAFIDDSANGFENGGWDSDLAGIWVGKYESSHSDATASSVGTSDTIKVIPNVRSWTSITIGNCYTNAYSYERTKESHLMKNSEWGAVAYLTHSQYGRNGHEIDINNSSSYITGNGGGSTSASSKSGIVNAYDSEIGQKASSTGNIYGIYDLSGGAFEYVASFNDTDMNNYESSNGSTFASPSNPSTKYATKYSNSTTTNYGTKIYEVGKTGDTTKETYKSSYYNWLGDYSYFSYASNPYFARGGYYNFNSCAGVFCSYVKNGSDNSDYSFRLVLAL